MKTARCLSRFAPVLLAAALSACSMPQQPHSSPSMGSSPARESGMTPSGVGYVGSGSEGASGEEVKVVIKEVNPFQPIIVRVSGTGAAPYTNSLTPSQRKLLAMRAARLDAFRSIAEQVQGMRLVGNSTVSNMIATSDSFRAYVDAYLRGVVIVSTTMKPDGTSEAIAEITLDQEFYKQFRNVFDKSGSVMRAAQETGAVGAQCPEGNCGATKVVPATAAPAAMQAPNRYSNNFYVTQ
ncbi:LPP20 family lipoprotein [Chromobacterium sp. IIBBL 290-4]|uniref:LPP20 family lipoprotein n=1 Tax=Chromobacterium sp. IIBBL 290-4 TaxID=2953890 RepID=UPI0020B8858A|nr:LPP20 family lipoprotein [Chromobacterium sp. IIBBL 290-4]UTH74176.1 LPP20 family lipoprotein [Chromobacterium sp. IIBBL 290-4]